MIGTEPNEYEHVRARWKFFQYGKRTRKRPPGLLPAALPMITTLYLERGNVLRLFLADTQLFGRFFSGFIPTGLEPLLHVSGILWLFMPHGLMTSELGFALFKSGVAF